MEQKTKELQILEAKFSALAKTATVINVTALSMALNAVVDTPPDGGVPVYRESFLRTDYLARNPSQEPLLQKLRAAIDEQVCTRFGYWEEMLTIFLRRVSLTSV